MRMALKYKWCFCALITACLLLTGLPLRAEELGVVTGSIVNIRKEPGTSNPILAKVKKGESFLVLAKSGDWVKIRLNNGQEGWISGSYLSIKYQAVGNHFLRTSPKSNCRNLLPIRLNSPGSPLV